MSEKKVLIIAYYWPPSGGSGVQRWLKFVKYLPHFGWKPVVFTPENPALVQQDESLLKDVPPEAEIIRYPIWEPYDAFFKLSSLFRSGSNTSVKPTQLTVKKSRSLFQRLASWIRGNFFIPDPKIFWVRPSVKFLDGYLKKNNIKTIITTGPPHSMHLIGYQLKKRNAALNWIADFRDPWSEWPFLDSFNRMKLVRNLHHKMERNVITSADHVVTITPFYQKRFEALSGRSVTLLTNGFDEDDFSTIQYQRPDKFTIRHVGIIYEMANPQPFVHALELLSIASDDFRQNSVVEFIGEVNKEYRKAFENSSIAEFVLFKDPVPHKELMKIYGTTSVLLLNLAGYQHAGGLLPGKIFEYMATGLPILGVGPVEGDANAAILQAKAGVMFASEDIHGIADFLKRSFLNWKESGDRKKPDVIEKYSRRTLAGELTSLLK